MIEHMLVATASIVNVTGLPDAPPVAVTLYVGPPTVAAPGADEVKLIVCEARVRLTVTGASAKNTGVPLSVTRTVRLNVVWMFRSRAALLLTVIWPVVASIANALLVFPEVM